MAVVGLLLSLLVSAAPAAAAAGPSVETAPTRSPEGYARVGTAYVGDVGVWTGTGSLSYELRWQLCNPHVADDCRTVASTATSDPDDTLSYTPSAADNFTERHLVYTVVATDDVGSTSWDTFVGRVLPARTWYEEARSGIRHADTAGDVDGAGVATVVGLTAVGTVWGLYAQRLTVGAPSGALELVYQTSRPQNDPTDVLAAEVDDVGRVHVAFLDDGGNLMVTERDPTARTWATPTRLAAAGTFQHNTFRDTDGQSLLAVAGNGRAAVAWVVGADDDDPPEMHVATRGTNGWQGASTHRLDQPKYIDCGEGYTDETIGDPTDAELGIDAAGDVTVIWSRLERACPGDAYQGYLRLEAAYRRSGAWSAVSQVTRTPGYGATFLPVAMDTTAAGTALALTQDVPTGGENLLLLTAASGSTFGSIDYATGAPAVELRQWRDGDGQMSTSGIDIVASDNGKLHVAWSTEGTGVPHTVEVASGTLSTVAPAVTVASRQREHGPVREPDLAVDEDGTAAVVFDGALLGDTSTVSYFALHDPQTGWGQPQTMDTTRVGASRFLGGPDAEISFDDAHRLAYFGNGSYGSSAPASLSRLAAGSAPPTVAVELRGNVKNGKVKVGAPVTLAPSIAEDPDGGSLSYAWDLDGDGQYDDAYTPEVQRSYAVAGRYPVKLMVTSTDGDFATSAMNVDVAANTAPDISGVYPENEPVAGQPMKYAAYAGDDFDDGAQLQYAWRFDSVLKTGQTGDTATHTFASGWHTVSITVTDTDGLSTGFERSVFVKGEDPPSYQLTVTRTGTGSGTVSGDGIDCGDDCTESYLAGTDILLTAQAAAGSTFTGWLGCDSQTEAGKCVVDMDGDTSVTAQFQPVSTTQHTLTVTKTGTGSGQVDGGGISCGVVCSKKFDAGEEVTLIADPSASSVFSGWEGCTTEVDDNCVVTMNGKVDVSAQFDAATTPQRTLTVKNGGAGAGTVTGPGIDCGDDCTTSVDQGSKLLLTADPGASSKVKGWTNCPEVVSGGLGCMVTLADDETVGATFVPVFGDVTTTIDSASVNSRKRKASIAFSGSSPAGVDYYECKLDRNEWATCSSTAVLKRLARGSHTFLVRTVDRDGIRDKTPAGVTFKVKRR